MGAATSRIELGTAVMPIQTRHPVAMAQQALVEPGRVRRPVHARPRPVAPLDRRGHARPPVREAGPPRAQLPRGAERGVRRARARSTSRTTTTACTTRSTSPTSPPRRSSLAALAPVMLRIAGELASGTILWMADERAIGEHVVPRITKRGGGRRDGPRRASSPAFRSCCAATTRSTRRARGRTRRSGTPSTRRTTSACSSTATPPTSATSRGRRRGRGRRSAAQLPRRGRHRPRGARAAVRARDRDARIESRDRTLAFARVALPRALSSRAGVHHAS